MEKTFYISGMHCVSCEILLEKDLKKIGEIDHIKVSYKQGTLKITGDNITLEKVKQVVTNLGYGFSEEQLNNKPSKKIGVKDLGQIILIFVTILVIAGVLSQFDIARFFPNIDEQIGFTVAFLLGGVASVSTCLAMIGGIVMSFSSEYTVQKNKKNPLLHRVLPQIYFHLGRIAGFTLLGWLLGSLGSAFNYTVSFTGYLTIVVAIFMFYIGLHILNIVPSITRFGFHLPKKLTTKIDDLQQKESPFIPAIIGVLTFFLPCGFTQSMQLAAVASGSFWIWAMIMFFFALGTFPVLFSVGLGSSYAQNGNFSFLKKVIGVVIVFFSLYSFNSGLILSGASFTIDFWNQIISSDGVLAETNEVKEQVVRLDIDYRFQQKEFHIKKDIPVRFEVNAIRVSGCTDEVIIPRLYLSTGKLKSGQMAVLEFTPTESGTLPFSCWMGMQGGRFIVE